eukprot:302591-Chlamydomonas_euryale.AAC.1
MLRDLPTCARRTDAVQPASRAHRADAPRKPHARTAHTNKILPTRPPNRALTNQPTQIPACPANKLRQAGRTSSHTNHTSASAAAARATAASARAPASSSCRNNAADAAALRSAAAAASLRAASALPDAATSAARRRLHSPRSSDNCICASDRSRDT